MSIIKVQYGCHWHDIDKNKCDLATSYGVHAINALNQNIANEVLNNTDGFGYDGVIITASSKSNEIMSNSTKISGKRGHYSCGSY